MSNKFNLLAVAAALTVPAFNAGANNLPTQPEVNGGEQCTELASPQVDVVSENRVLFMSETARIMDAIKPVTDMSQAQRATRALTFDDLSESHPSQDGELRGLSGTTDIDIYNDGTFTFATSVELGDDLVGPVAQPNQAYVVNEIELGLIPHTSLETWVRIRFFRFETESFFECNVPGFPPPAGFPLAGEKLGEVVANLGFQDFDFDGNGTQDCNNFFAQAAKRRINLVTGEVTKFHDQDPEIISNAVKKNVRGPGDTNNVGSGIPFGPGNESAGVDTTGLALAILENRVLIDIYYGVDDGSGMDVMDAPEDVRCTSVGFSNPGTPGAFNWASGAVPTTGGSSAAILADIDGNHIYSCNENVSFGFSFQTPNLILRGELAPDCNTNGLPDSFDIAAGSADDCNGDNVIDECESGDCNTNGIPDVCDIAAGTSNPNGDGDDSGGLDLRDFALLQQCFTGDAPFVPGLIPSYCCKFDFDGNGFIDLDDASQFIGQLDPGAL